MTKKYVKELNAQLKRVLQTGVEEILEDKGIEALLTYILNNLGCRSVDGDGEIEVVNGELVDCYSHASKNRQILYTDYDSQIGHVLSHHILTGKEEVETDSFPESRYYIKEVGLNIGKGDYDVLESIKIDSCRPEHLEYSNVLNFHLDEKGKLTQIISDNHNFINGTRGVCIRSHEDMEGYLLPDIAYVVIHEGTLPDYLHLHDFVDTEVAHSLGEYENLLSFSVNLNFVREVITRAENAIVEHIKELSDLDDKIKAYLRFEGNLKRGLDSDLMPVSLVSQNSKAALEVEKVLQKLKDPLDVKVIDISQILLSLKDGKVLGENILNEIVDKWADKKIGSIIL